MVSHQQTFQLLPVLLLLLTLHTLNRCTLYRSTAALHNWNCFQCTFNFLLSIFLNEKEKFAIPVRFPFLTLTIYILSFLTFSSHLLSLIWRTLSFIKIRRILDIGTVPSAAFDDLGCIPIPLHCIHVSLTHVRNLPMPISFFEIKGGYETCIAKAVN